MSEGDDVEEGQLRDLRQGSRVLRLRVVRVASGMATLEVEGGRDRGSRWMWSLDVVRRATELVEGE